MIRPGLLDAGGNPLLGRGAVECDPLVKDDHTWAVSWKGETQVSDKSPVKLQFDLQDADIFGFRFAR